MKTVLLKFLLLTLLLSGPVNANERAVYLVTGNEAYPPLTGKDLPKGGMFTEIALLAFSRMGFEPEIDYEDWEVGKNLMLKRQAYVATFPYVKNDERTKLFMYSRPVYFANRSIFKRPGTRWKFEDLHRNRIHQKKVACRPVGYHLGGLQELIKQQRITLKRPAAMADCFEDLINKKVDFAMFIDYVGDKWLKNNGLDSKVVKEKQPIGEDAFHLIFPKTNRNVSELINGFNTELDKMENSGELDNIIEFHLNYHYAN